MSGNSETQVQEAVAAMPCTEPRILLINSQGLREESDTPGVNIGMGYVAAAFRRDGWDVSYIDEIRSHLAPAEVAALAARLGPFDAIGLHVLTRFVPHVVLVLKEIRKLFPGTPMIIGGPFPSTMPEASLMKLPDVDAALEGEIEGAFPMLGVWLRGECLSADVPGLWARDGHGNVVRGRPRVFPSLDDVPIPAWDVVRPELYFDVPGSRFASGCRAIPTVFTRGCPYSCTYCSAHCITGRKLRCRPIPQLIDELRFLKKEYGAREVMCMDDGLTLNRSFILELCSAIREADLGLVFSAPYGVRLDSLDEGVLAAMEVAGFHMIAVGIEAGTQSRLDQIKKNLTIEVVRSKVKLVKERTRMTVTGFFILGYPGETLEEARATIRLACELPLDGAVFFSCILIPGTQLHEDAVSTGIVDSDCYESRSCLLPGLTYARYSQRRLHVLVVGAYLRFYLHPKRLFGLIHNIRSPGQFKQILRSVWTIIRG